MAMKVTPVTAVTAPAAYSGTLHSEHGDRLQHYHRQVTLMLLPAAPPGRPALRLLLDQEPQRPGEDEVQTALRLLRRVLARYPRAFDWLARANPRTSHSNNISFRSKEVTGNSQ